MQEKIEENDSSSSIVKFYISAICKNSKFFYILFLISIYNKMTIEL